MQEGAIALTLDDSSPLMSDQVVLATRFVNERPGGPWLTCVIVELKFVCSTCGYPLINRSLRWHEGLYVLEIGPVVRNIMGARLAAQRLARAVLVSSTFKTSF